MFDHLSYLLENSSVGLGGYASLFLCLAVTVTILFLETDDVFVCTVLHKLVPINPVEPKMNNTDVNQLLADHLSVVFWKDWKHHPLMFALH